MIAIPLHKAAPRLHASRWPAVARITRITISRITRITRITRINRISKIIFYS